MIGDFVKGASYVFKGFSLLQLKGVKRYVVIPALINFILFTTAIWFGYNKIDQLLDQFLPSWLAWLEFLLLPLFIIASLIIVFFVFTIVANILGAPFNSLLSEKIELHINMPHPPENTQDTNLYLSIVRSATNGIGNEIKKLLYITARAIPLLILFLIPGINVIAPFLWFIFGAWMLAIEYFDYPMGNREILFKRQLTLLKQKRYLSLGLGAALLFMTIIPGLNFFAMPVGVAAATALWVDHYQ